MTIKTTLFPMGYKFGSPQPTGDTPGNLLGLAYCYENYDDSDIETINNQETIVVEIKEDVFRYNVDLSNYSGNADTVYIKYDISTIVDELEVGDGIAYEIWVKQRPDKDNGVAFYAPDIPSGRLYQISCEYYETSRRKDTTVIYEHMLYKISNSNYEEISRFKTLETL